MTPIDVIVIGGGQAGLSVGYYLARRKVRFVILESDERVGDVWRKRWNSLRLFTPARFNGLAGMRFPGPPDSFPTKDAMADYLEAYAQRFDLPVRTGTRVERLFRRGGQYVVSTTRGELTAPHVVVAMATFQRPLVPAFASELLPGIKQIHSSAYKGPHQLEPGPVLVAGAGNSGAEIALELARSNHAVVLSGRDTGAAPIVLDSFWGRFILARLLLRVFFHRVLTIKSRLGQKMRRRMGSHGAPLIRVRSEHLTRAGVERAPRVTAVQGGLPALAGGRVLDVKNVVWCTGFDHGFSWIDRPVFAPDGELLHDGGVAQNETGLYFVGLHFLYAFSSTMIHGVGRDAERIVRTIGKRLRSSRATAGIEGAAPLHAVGTTR